MAEWMPDVERIESAAIGDPIEPRAVMSHIMQGYQSTMIRWAQERGTEITRISSHFTIGKNGRIAQHVPIRTQAWHAGRLDPGRRPEWRLLPAGGNPNDFAVSIEHEGFSGEPWPEPQAAATLRVHRWLFAELALIPSEDTVIGHFMTSPVSRAHDPGSGWPRDRILHALRVQRAAAERIVGEPAAPELRLPQAEFESAVLNAFFGVLSHSYSVREDDQWQYIEIRRPKPWRSPPLGGVRRSVRDAALEEDAQPQPLHALAQRRAAQDGRIADLVLAEDPAHEQVLDLLDQVLARHFVDVAAHARPSRPLPGASIIAGAAPRCGEASGRRA